MLRKYIKLLYENFEFGFHKIKMFIKCSIFVIKYATNAIALESFLLHSETL